MLLPENSLKTQSDDQAATLDLMWLLAQVHSLLGQGYQQQVSEFPISFDGILFLSIAKLLGENATQSEISRWMVRRQNTVSSMIQRLEKKGFIKKKKVTKPNNRAAYTVVMTKKGEQLHNELVQKSDILFEVMSALTLEEKRQCRRYLFKIRAAAAKRIKNYEEPPYPSP